MSYDTRRVRFVKNEAGGRTRGVARFTKHGGAWTPLFLVLRQKVRLTFFFFFAPHILFSRELRAPHKKGGGQVDPRGVSLMLQAGR